MDRLFENLNKLLQCDVYDINAWSQKSQLYSMEELLISAWGNRSGNSHKWFKRFLDFGFILKENNNGSSRYFISPKNIEKYIKKKSEFAILLKRIDEIEDVFN